MKVPAVIGIDSGWGFNVGKSAYFPSPGRFTDPTLGRQVATLAVSGREFADFISGKVSGFAPVAYIDEELARAIKSDAREVRLSEATVTKQLARHPDLSITEYRLLPDVVDKGLVIRDGDEILVFFNQGNQLYQATIKRTRDGNELHLVSYQRATDSDIRRLRRRGKVLRE